MCNGKMLSEEVGSWLPWADVAQEEESFSRIPERSGVYVLRTSQAGISDMTEVKRRFMNSPFMKSQARTDAASDAFFAHVGLGEGRGWTLASLYSQRLERLDRIELKAGKPTCPIIYIGRANDLRRRMRELAFGGHTANSPFWALLLAGWEFDVGFQLMRKKAETAEEARLKSVFARSHTAKLPPLVQR